ncbi:MAG: hypothetical protein SGILL_001967 [Bacillariaceae sp.]
MMSNKKAESLLLVLFAILAAASAQVRGGTVASTRRRVRKVRDSGAADFDSKYMEISEEVGQSEIFKIKQRYLKEKIDERKGDKDDKDSSKEEKEDKDLSLSMSMSMSLPGMEKDLSLSMSMSMDLEGRKEPKEDKDLELSMSMSMSMSMEDKEDKDEKVDKDE